MPEAPVLASHPRGGRIVPILVALGAERGEHESPWAPELELAGFALSLSARPRETGAEIQVSVRNAAQTPRMLDRVRVELLWTPPRRAPLEVLSFVEAPAASAVAALERDRVIRSQNLTLVGGGADGVCVLLGALAGSLSLPATRVRAESGGVGLALSYRVAAQLMPGEQRQLETAVLAVGDDPGLLLEDFAESWGRSLDARTWRPAPLVWELSGPADDDALRRDLDALSALGESLPVEVALLSPKALATPGDWTRGAPGYRRGLEAAAETIRAAGFVPGLQLAPGLAAPESQLCRARPGAFAACGRSDGLLVLDAACDAALAELESQSRQLRDAGFFFLALDTPSEIAPAAADPGPGPAARTRRVLESVRRGASDEAFLLMRGGALGPGVGVVDARWIDGAAAAPEVQRRSWMHRRLWLGACADPAAADAGAMLVARGDPSLLRGPELERWSRAADRARRADEGLPGVARPLDPLASPVRLAPDPRRIAAAPPLAVFCDFDGTFSVQDVGATLAKRFGGERRARVWARYERGEITPWQYNLEILDGLPVDTAALEAFLAGVELDPGARELLDWCQARGVPFRILSDGFDWNLNRLQSLHRVRFAYTANTLRVEHGRWRIGAGAPDPGCGCGTGTCKAAVLRSFRERHPGAHRVHIGNGRVSDLCGAVEADTAFAKDSLAQALSRQGQPYRGFETLDQVIPHLEEILGRRRRPAASGPSADALR